MIKLPLVLAFTALTFLSWGVYGVLLHAGQENMDHAYLKPFIGVGIAYFLIAVLIPGTILTSKGEKGHWSFMGTVLSLLAGGVGALGALGIIMALKSGGNPAYVMPFVFGLAPVVNTLVTASINKTFAQINFLFMVGLLLVILGAVGVLISKPKPPKPATSHAAIIDEEIMSVRPVALQETTPAVSEDGHTIPAEKLAAATRTEKDASNEQGGMISIVLSMIIAAFCWGAYGPVLHVGQSKMGGSRLRPFCCVGLAYFFIAVALPLAMLQAGMDSGTSHLSGWAWSIAAGAAGAVGALGIIYAFNFGGKPIFVMPLVFGFAPIVNTITSMSTAGTLGEIKPTFLGALATTIAGAVMVLVFQPRPKKPVAVATQSTKKFDSPKPVDAVAVEPTNSTVPTIDVPPASTGGVTPVVPPPSDNNS